MSFCGGCPNSDNVFEAPRVESKGKTVVVTDAASKFIRAIMEKQKKTGWGLRLAVIPGGCAGYKYFMQFQEKAFGEDSEIEVSGIKFIFDQESFELIKGSEIDYVESLEASGLKINNPNATRACGCGKSFG